MIENHVIDNHYRVLKGSISLDVWCVALAGLLGRVSVPPLRPHFRELTYLLTFSSIDVGALLPVMAMPSVGALHFSQLTQ